MACKKCKVKKSKSAPQPSTKPVYSGNTAQPGLKAFSPIEQQVKPPKKPGFREWLKRQGKKLGHGLFGKADELAFLRNMTPEQEDFLVNILESAKSDSQNPYEGFEPIRQDALRTFYSDIVPRLYENFTASGNNAISSPVLHQNLSSAGAELASRLAALQSNYGMQNKQFALSKGQLGLTSPYTQSMVPGYTGLIPGLLGMASGGIGKSLGKRAAERFF